MRTDAGLTWAPVAVRRFMVAALLAIVLVSCGSDDGTGAVRTNVPVERASQSNSVASAFSGPPVTMTHIHGLGFDATGDRLLVAAHDGLRVFEGGRWSVPDIPGHDYMGFSAVDDGFYSSGHPSPVSDLVNPLGLVRSTDGGRSIETLALSGESDLHLMAVGYHSHVVYAVNQVPGQTLEAGIFRSIDDGGTWRRLQPSGGSGDLIQLAVHPTDPDTVVLATSTGLYRSTDGGGTFSAIVDGAPITAATFSPSTGDLFFGFRVFAVDREGAAAPEQLTAPPLSAEDAILAIAAAPDDPDHIAIATYERSIFESTDGGATWSQIADHGTAIDAR